MNGKLWEDNVFDPRTSFGVVFFMFLNSSRIKGSSGEIGQKPIIFAYVEKILQFRRSQLIDFRTLIQFHSPQNDVEIDKKSHRQWIFRVKLKASYFLAKIEEKMNMSHKDFFFQ